MSQNENEPRGWCFDPVPPSGARQGGDPSEYVFASDVSALVRETLQNSNDQISRAADRIHVTLRLERFEGERLDDLRAAFDWESLRTHLVAVEVARARFERGLEMMDSDSVTCLWIEDRGTTGLAGGERGSGNFAALCRDRLFSEKQRAESGGSFGLGKAVLWRFSHVSTVAFYSKIADGPDAGRDRFIIKAALPFHVLPDGREFSGDGWFGRVETLAGGAGDRAISLWDDRAKEVATMLGARPFGEGEAGTSIFIAGFGVPAHDDADDGESIELQLHAAARRSFWPALNRNRLAVRVGESDVEVGAGGVEASLAAMLGAYDQQKEVSTLGNTLDVAVERISVQLPARKDGAHHAVEACADVIIQLADEDEKTIGGMWCFRGPGMLIEYRDLRSISLSARPFRAILVCGEALRDRPKHTAALEAFLKDAEPPAHDRWIQTPRLKEAYRQGWGVALQRLMDAAQTAIKKHVVGPVNTSANGPDRLRRLFKVGTVGGGRSESDFHFHNLSAKIVEGAWHFKASVLPNLPTDSAWRTIIDVEFCEERGRGRVGGTLAHVEVEGAEVELIDGRARILAPAGTHAVKISGRTDPQRHPVATHEAAIELVLRSRAEVEP